MTLVYTVGYNDPYYYVTSIHSSKDKAEAALENYLKDAFPQMEWEIQEWELDKLDDLWKND